MDVARDYRALRSYIMRRSRFILTFMVGLKPDLRQRIGQMNFELRIADLCYDDSHRVDMFNHSFFRCNFYFNELI